MVNKRVRNAVLGCNLKNDRMISVRLQGKPFNITVIQVYAPTSNTEEAEVEWFHDLQDLLELTPPKDVFFILGEIFRIGLIKSFIFWVNACCQIFISFIFRYSWYIEKQLAVRAWDELWNQIEWISFIACDLKKFIPPY